MATSPGDLYFLCLPNNFGPTPSFIPLKKLFFQTFPYQKSSDWKFVNYHYPRAKNS